MLMVAFLDPAAEARAAAFARLHPPTVLASPIRSGSHFGQSVGRTAHGKMVEAPRKCYALSAN
jgi:hypothetical protein